MAQLASPHEHSQGVAVVQSVKQARRRKWRRHNPLTMYLFVSPWIIGFLCLTLIPLIYALAVSFTNFDGLSGHWHFIGWRNYQELFHDPATWNSLWRTLFLTLIVVPVSIIGGLGLAVLVNQRLRAVGLFRTLFYLPSIVPAVAAATMWKFVFDSGNGPVSALLEILHLPQVEWLIDPVAFFTLMLVILWGIGGGMIISLAGLQGIPVELQEAAKIDGATAWQVFTRVTLPLLSPVIFFQVITGVIAAQQILVQPLLLSPSGVGAYGYIIPKSSQLYMVNVYLQFYVNHRFGYGSALLWVFFAIVVVMTLLIFRFSRFLVYYEVDEN